ncbi:MAG: DUF4326 domain-containing protein [Akkermansiaceae bacterium]
MNKPSTKEKGAISRLQRTRKKGSKLPENTVCVTRGTRWGNPFIEGEHGNREEVVKSFRRALYSGELKFNISDVRRELVGKNLACWCKVGTPCHAETLFEIANTKGFTQ